jgi:hypothetical protein
MFKGLKINIAIIICVAFLFRLFSLSLSSASSPNESNIPESTYLTYVIKKGTSFVESEKNSKPIFTEIIFSEEDPDDENEHKSFTPILLESFCSLTVRSIESHVKAITPINKHFASNSSQRHLEFGVFRI